MLDMTHSRVGRAGDGDKGGAGAGGVQLCSSVDTATHCNTLQHNTKHYNALQCIATHCNALQHAATRCHAGCGAGVQLYSSVDTATHCNTLRRTATHGGCGPRGVEICCPDTLHYTAIHCTALQHAAAHCNTLHCTAIHCTALQHTEALTWANTPLSFKEIWIEETLAKETSLNERDLNKSRRP